MQADWAETYFATLAAMLIFSIGLPLGFLHLDALPLQLRNLVPRFVWFQFFVLLVVLVLVAVVLMWTYDPGGFWPGPGPSLVAPLLMTVAAGFTLEAWLVWWFFLSHTGLGWYLARKSRRLINSGPPAGRERILDELALFGEYSRAGEEKEKALRILEGVLEALLETKQYDGTRLGRPVEAIVRTIVGHGPLGNQGNLGTAVDILLRARAGTAADRSPDRFFIDSAIQRLVRSSPAQTFGTGQRLLGIRNPEVQLAVGLAAWRAGDFVICASAVSKLRAAHQEAMTQGEPTSEVLSCTLALLAQVATGSFSARQWSDAQLSKVLRDTQDAVLAEEVSRARGARYDLGDFESADALSTWEEKLLASRGEKAVRWPGTAKGRRKRSRVSTTTNGPSG